MESGALAFMECAAAAALSERGAGGGRGRPPRMARGFPVRATATGNPAETFATILTAQAAVTDVLQASERRPFVPNAAHYDRTNPITT